jgi:hypothetical protein
MTRPAQTHTPDFLAEIETLLSMFNAALDMDDWDFARAAFLSLSQNAWDAHILLAGDTRLRCPALSEDDRQFQIHFMEV